MNLVNFENLYSRLNVDQKKAVDTIDGSVLVIAGPGTGKTQVLSLRIANILRLTDTNPNSILCLTFQDASVVAMKNRLQKFIGNDAFKVNIHTFHSFCSEVIRSFPHEFYFSSSVEPIKDIDKLGIFKDILVENKLTSLQKRNDILGFFDDIVRTISTLKKEYISPEKLTSFIKNYEENLDVRNLKTEQKRIEKMYDVQKFYQIYVERMRDLNLIDFDDMIFYVTEAFSRKDDFVKYFQEQYLYTLVDEFQDTNNAQLEVITSIASFEGLESNVFAVGDDDQTIFRFQGASSSNFDKYLNIFPSTEIIVLHTNYRSNQEIIDASTNVIKNNPSRISESPIFQERELNKNFQAFNNAGISSDENSLTGKLANSHTGKLTSVHEFDHSFHEDYWIGKKINEIVESGATLNEIAIITRNNKQIVNITKFLDKFNIGYVIRRSESILNNKYVQNILQICDIISDPFKLKNDQVMWEILSQDFLGLNSFDVFGLVHDAKEQKTNMYDFVMKTHLPKYESIYKFVNQIIALQHYSHNNSVLNTFTKIIHTFEIIKYLETLEESAAELNRLSSIYQFISTRTKVKDGYTLKDLVDETKLMREKNIILAIDPIDINLENKINIITAHSSKGLEFEYVFLYQSIESKWEKSRGAGFGIKLPPLGEFDPQELKEIEKIEDEIDERRLFYVAMTRAKKNLFITYSKKYFDSDSGELDIKEKIKSQFVAESNIEHFENHSDLSKEHTEISRILLTSEDPVIVPDKNKNYLENLVNKNLKLSASKLRKYNDCHYKFMLEDIYGLPLPKSLNMEIGTAIHKGIETLVKSYGILEGKPVYMKFDDIYKVALEELDRNLDKDQISNDDIGSLDVAYNEIKTGLSAYYDFFILNPEKPELSEFMTVGIYEGIRLSGRIDKVSKLKGAQEGSRLVITDYKTCSSIPSVKDFLGLNKNSDKAHLRQLLFYRLLLENSSDPKSKLFSKNLTSVRIEYIDTKLGEVSVFELPKSGIFEYKERVNAKKIQEFDIDAEYEILKKDLLETFESIKNLKFERTTDRNKCQFCAFKRHCGR